MARQSEIQRVRNEVVELANELKNRIPVWISHQVPLERRRTTEKFGVMQKSAHFVEQIVKGIVSLLVYTGNEKAKDIAGKTERLTLGASVRTIKELQNHSAFYQRIEKTAVCDAKDKDPAK